MFENLTSDPNAPLPSLNALRAFEAMARTGSATRAAEELHVTHSAVSRQVKALEAQMGVRLFEGPRHALTLTPSGSLLLPALTTAFDQIASAVSKARGSGHDLHIAVNASLAVKWLIPRLPDLAQRHPSIRAHLAELAPHALTHRGADIVLRLLTREQLEQTGAYALCPNSIGPVISPKLVSGDAKLALKGVPHLVAKTQPSAWQDWNLLTGQTLAAHTAFGQPLAHIHYVLDATLSGMGAAIMPWAVAADAIKDGLLIAPYGFVPDGGAMAATFGAGEITKPRKALMQWLLAQGRGIPVPPLYKI